MAEDHDRSHKTGKAAWLKIFTGFKLALDPKKLVLAGAGIFVMFLGWWVISWVFFNLNSTPPSDEAGVLRWTLLYELASNPSQDMADNIAGVFKKTDNEEQDKQELAKRKIISDRIEEVLQAPGNENLAKKLKERRHGLLRSCPWDEYRGPNQLTVVEDAIQQYSKAPNIFTALRPYSKFVVEPLYKFLLPVTYYFDSRAGDFLNRFYLILIILWTVFTWGFFGGAITRIVAVQFARNEKVGLLESLKFVGARWQGYLFAPLLPLALLLVFSIIFWVFGLVIGWIPFLGDLLAALLWPLSLIAGLIMAVVLVGLVGWPLMNATISTEGSDSFDALSRSYSYVFQAPWHCLGNALLSIAYGAVLVFFVGFMGTLLVYLGKWGVSQAPHHPNRDPASLFVNAPRSFGWRDALLRDSPHAVKRENQLVDELKLTGDDKLDWNNNIATFGVGIWLTLFFLLIIGFGYSYFWTAAGIIYMLVRQKVDDTDLDEVYLEEDPDQPFIPDGPSQAAPAAAPTPASTAPPGVTFTMVEPPAPPPPAPAAPSPPSNTDATGKE